MGLKGFLPQIIAWWLTMFTIKQNIVQMAQFQMFTMTYFSQITN